jgi:type VI protein secretion system component Hcp
MSAAPTPPPASTLRVIRCALVCWLALAVPALAGTPKSIGTLTVEGEDGLANLAIVAYQWAARTPPPAAGGGSGGGKTTFDAFTVTKLVDATAPALLRLTVTTQGISTVRIAVPLRRGTTATYVLSDAVIVLNDRHTPEGGGPSLQTLGFSAQANKETVLSPGGSVTTCFNVVTQDPNCP